MTTETTIIKSHEMRLSAMAELYYSQLRDPQYNELSFEDRFNLLVDGEWIRRGNNKLERLIRTANLRFNNASKEDIEYHPDRKLDKTQILRLATCNYSEVKYNIIINGASGNRKS